MKVAMRSISLGLSTVLAAAAMTVVLAPPASAQVIVRLYPHTTAGAKKCNADKNVAGPPYYCTTHKLGSDTYYALARP